MSISHDHDSDGGLEETASLLREQRHEASALELDQLKRRARAQASARRRSTLFSLEKGTLVASRLMITVLLALGILVSTTGATLAIAPQVVGYNAAYSQYQTDDDDDGNTDDDDDGREDDDDDNDDNDDSGPPPDDPPGDTPPPVLGGSGGGGSSDPSDPSDPAVAGTAAGGTNTEPAVGGGDPEIQAVRQESAEEGDLPFTGFAAIPVLVIGVMLLTSGLFLRRRSLA